jgi:hypothetical protein
MAFEIAQGFKRTVTNTYTKADGTPGQLDGIPVWSAVPEGFVTIVPAADGLSADVIWAGSATGVVVSALADGDLGTGVFPISISNSFDLVAPLGAVAGSSTVSDQVAV